MLAIITITLNTFLKKKQQILLFLSCLYLELCHTEVNLLLLLII
jgi:hypothetical protein